MDKTYMIDPQRIDACVRRQMKKVTLGLIIIFTPFCLLLPLLMNFRVKSSIPAAFFAAIGFGCYLFLKNLSRNMVAGLQIKLTPDGVIRSHDIYQMNVVASTTLELTTAKTSEKLDCIMRFSRITATKIKDHEIIIEAGNASSINNIGIIKIPKEMAGFQEIATHIKSHSRDFRLVS